jgi:hypothetical protein
LRAAGIVTPLLEPGVPSFHKKGLDAHVDPHVGSGGHSVFLRWRMIARIACSDDRLPIKTKIVGVKAIDLDELEAFDVLTASETEGRIGLIAGAAKIGIGHGDISVRDAPTRSGLDMDAHFELVRAAAQQAGHRALAV